MLKGKNQKYLKFYENGRAGLDFGKKSKKKIDKLMKKDEGLQLASDLINAKDKDGNDMKFLYSRDPSGATNKLTGNEVNSFGLSSGEEITKNGGKTFFLNASNTAYGKDDNGKVVNNDYAPKSGYTGQVSLAPGTVKALGTHTGWEGDNFVYNKPCLNVVNRSDMLKHELRENLLRSGGMNYQDAHSKTDKMYNGAGSGWSTFKAD